MALDGERVLEHANARVGDDALPQHAPDLAPGRIGRVQHTPHAVRAFGCERRLAVGVAIEPRAPLDELARIARPFVARAREPRARRTGRRRRSSCRAACSSGESSGPIAAAMPPCAYSVLLSLGSAFVMMTMSPAGASSTAARSPAIPLPTIMKSPRTSTGCYTTAHIASRATSAD